MKKTKCTIKEVQKLIDVSTSKASRMMQQCRDALNKPKPKLLFLDEFAEYWELDYIIMSDFISRQPNSLSEQKINYLQKINECRKFTGKHFGGIVTPITIKDETLRVKCEYRDSIWYEDWNLQHTLWGFEQEEYQFLTIKE